MSQKAQIRECTIEELYTVPAQPPQQPTKVISITTSASASQHSTTTKVGSPATTPHAKVSVAAPLTVPPVAEKSFLQKHALLITLTVIVAIGVGIYLYRREKKKEQNQ